jgi:hypothetical protein
LTRGEPEVAHDRVERRKRPGVAAILFQASHVTERAAGFSDSAGTRHPASHQLGDTLIQVCLDLFVEVVVQPAPREELAKRDHAPSSESTRVMPSSIRSKLETSRVRCLAPSFVR